MFDAVRNNKRIVQVFLALITLPFAFWGVDSYVRNAANDEAVAKIGKEVRITSQQFKQELGDKQDRFRAQLGPMFDPKMMDSPEVRRGVLNEMIDRSLLLLEASKTRVVATDDALRKMILTIPSFQENGKFSMEKFENLLKMQGMTPAIFESRLRQDIAMQHLAGTVARSGVASKTVGERTVALQAEAREVQELRFAPDAYLAQVKLDDAAARKFYDTNTKQFEIPEQAKVEFVILSQDAVATQVAVSEEEVKAWYDGHKGRYQVAEERRASHILFKAEGKDKPAAKAKAEEALKELQKNPAAFADVAKKQSQDPGSAEKGGDLGFFGRGMMVKPFEDTAFKLKEGEMSGLVESEFGFHIIKVTGVRAAKEKPLSEVRAEIETELKRGAATRKFAEAAESFSNLVYEQSDSLKAAADKFKLTVQQSPGWIGRQANAAGGPLANEKLLKSLFSEDSIKSRRNTEAVEIAPNTLVSARLVDYKPAALQPFDAVKAGIETRLKRDEALALARKAGEEKLAALKKAPDDKLAWSAAKKVSRLDPASAPGPALAAVFRVDAAALPAYAGADVPGAGYFIYKVVKIAAADKGDEERRKQLAEQLGNLAMQEEMQTYLAALRARYKVEIDRSLLESKDK